MKHTSILNVYKYVDWDMSIYSPLHLRKIKLSFWNKSTLKPVTNSKTQRMNRFRMRARAIFSSGARVSGPGPLHYRGFTIILRHTTLDGTPLDEWSAHRRDLYLTTRNICKRQTATTPAGFERAILASQRLQTHALDRADTGFGTRSTGLVWSVIGISPWRNTQARLPGTQLSPKPPK